VFRDEREVAIAAPAGAVFRAVCRLGGRRGWYADWLWKIRGGTGSTGRRTRPSPRPAGSRYAQVRGRSRFLASGRFGQDRSLSLRAEMRLPGQALLDFRIGANGAQNCTLRQTALFEPRGLFGLMYWYAVLPLHGVVFRVCSQAFSVTLSEMAALERAG
jgi:hypothetical protein